MSRIIPGVQVTVVKEVVPPQLAPSGVLGLIGLTENQPEQTERASSWSRFLEVFGPGSAFSMPEGKQALENGVFELVVAPLASSAALASAVDVPKNNSQEPALKVKARAAGTWANGYKIKVASSATAEDAKVFDLTVLKPGGSVFEVHRKLSSSENSERYVITILKQESALIFAESVAESAELKDNEYELTGGKDAVPADYDAALAALENEPDVDMVLASIQDFSAGTESNVTKIYSKLISHCERMSKDSKGRIGFGQVAPAGKASDYTNLASNLVSDRFVLLAPNGVAGAVAGRVGSLAYYQSPTFKTLSGLGQLPRVLGVEEQRTLLKGNVVPVVNQRGRGIIVLRGLTTDGDQVSVRRVADRAVRGVKMLGDLFIGRLNNEDGRGALKQKLIEFLVQMEKDGAIVPSTDGTDPSFKVDVYSSQADFAKGIVRVDMAVRPVRAIDYIYATILVQV